MKITSIGGGPGGLYAAILLKRAHPDAQITVYERNAPDDTFGFGVVFSAATLAGLEDADAPSYDTMTRAMARWDPVEVRYGGERVRAHGNRFAAISRHLLLRILQERARELGVDLRFATEIDDPESVRDADLVLGADGLNSRVRARYADAFGPRLSIEGSKFIWLGTTKRFDVFTFIFLETEWGPFQAHIYPFSDDTSTFIVECAPDIWRRAGFDAVDAADLPPGVSDDASIKRLSELFADHLDGHELIPNNSKWLDWTTVRNRSWRHENVVLLGDAAHTAHFSIGSGTKLAMEDAIALAQALDRSDDLDEALLRYEGERRPAVERVQQAAAESLDWFARYRRYWGFPPPQFAYSLLTRSGRVDHDNMRRRDPQLVTAVDRWFAEEADGGDHTRPRLLPPPPARTPLAMPGGRLRNRLVLTPDDDQAASDGMPSASTAHAVDDLADAGPGLVLVERMAISPEARATPGDLGCWTEEQVELWRDLIARARARGSRAWFGCQLAHAGPRGATRPRTAGVDLPLRDGGWSLVAASPLARTWRSAVPTALDRDGMAVVRDQFVAAADRALAAGFDLLELRMSDGELCASFLSPLTNHRDDEYGGDVAGRMRFPLEVVDAVRAAWPADRPLSVALTVDDLEPGGLRDDDAIAIARACVQHGADLVHATAGGTTPAARPDYRPTYGAGASDLVRNGALVPTLADGGIHTVGEADHLVAAGVADLCLVGSVRDDEPGWLARLRTP